MYIKRTAEDVVKKLSNQFKVILVTGARQVGKSTLLKHCDKNRNYVSLDDLTEREMAINEPKLFLENHKTPLIIDLFAEKVYNNTKYCILRLCAVDINIMKGNDIQ